MRRKRVTATGVEKPAQRMQPVHGRHELIPELVGRGIERNGEIDTQWGNVVQPVGQPGGRDRDPSGGKAKTPFGICQPRD